MSGSQMISGRTRRSSATSLLFVALDRQAASSTPGSTRSATRSHTAPLESERANNYAGGECRGEAIPTRLPLKTCQKQTVRVPKQCPLCSSFETSWLLERLAGVVSQMGCGATRPRAPSAPSRTTRSFRKLVRKAQRDLFCARLPRDAPEPFTPRGFHRRL